MIHPNGEPHPQLELPPPSPSGPRGHAWLAWLAILALTAGVVWAQNAGSKAAPIQEARSTTSLVLLEINLRIGIGGLQALTAERAKAREDNGGKAVDDEQMEKARTTLRELIEKNNRGPIEQRLRAIIALAEMEGAARAVEELGKLKSLLKEQEREPTPDEARWLDILERLYADIADGRPEAPTVSPEERRDLRAALGWFGELATHPTPADPERPDPAREQALAAAQRTFRTAMSAGLFAVLALLVGVLGLLLFALRLVRGKVASRLGPPTASHAVYAETFAVWLFLFVGLNLAGPMVLRDRVPRMVAACVIMLLSLLALAWPVMRGLSWRQVREDVGLTLGRQPLLEPSHGVLCYFLSLPFLLIGLLIAVPLLTRAASGVPGEAGDPFAPDVSVAHPIIEQFARGSLRDWVPVFLVGCVIAPIVEEIMFRGVLYRHLRDATRGAPAWSVIVAALVVNVIFAVVHPQGLLAVPLLASLACGFVLAREWRGTLLPGILAHAINNTVVFTILLGLVQ